VILILNGYKNNLIESYRMPRVAMDFSKTVIYHFVCEDTNVKCSYVGSTTNIIKRKAQHKSACKIEKGDCYNKKLYQTIRDNGGWTNWKMIPLEEFECENKTQQVIREQYWIDQLKPELNCLPAYLTEEGKVVGRQNAIKKYVDINQEKVNESQKKYREAHSEKILDKAKEYYHTHLKNDDEYKERKKIYHKEWRAKLRASQNIHTDPSSMPVLDCQDPTEGSR
jgi:hypothetical protein